MKPSMQKKLAGLSDRIHELNTLLSSETITNDMDHYRKITKEHSDITPIVDEYHAYKKNEDNLNAEKTLLNGLKIDVNNESLLYALAFQYSKLNQIEKAKTVLIKLVQLYPNNRDYQSFLQQILSTRGN